MGASVRPEGARPESADPRVLRNVQRMRAAGKSQDEIAAYQAYEAQQSAPAAVARPAAAAGFAAESTAATPRRPEAGTPARSAGVPDAPYSGSRGSALNPIASGMSAGFADEVLPVAGWLGESAARLVTGSKPRGYRESTEGMREDMRGQASAYAADHPVRNTVGELAGGLAAAVAGGGGLFGSARAALGRRLGAGAGRTALTAAAEGGAAGATAGAGATNGTPGERLAGALVGGTLGAATGGITSGSGSLFLSARNLLGPARTGGAATRKADELILRNLERDGVSLGDLTGTHTAATSASGGAKPRMLLDAAGSNTQGLAETVTTIPSKGRETVTRALNERQRGQQGRISQDLVDFLRMGDEDALDVTEKLVASKRAAAKDAYAKAYARGQVDVPEVVQAIEEVPQFRKAYAAGRQLIRLEDGRTLPPLYETTVVGGEEVKTLRPLTIEMIDAMKQGLDEVIGAGMRAGTMGKKTARLLRNRLRSTLEAVDVAAPEYAAARAQFAGDVALEKALAAGEKLLATDPRLVEKTVAAMTDGEKEMFRVGALKALRRNMAKATPGRDVSSRVAGESAASERERLLRAIAPDEESFQKLRDLTTSEAKMAEARRQTLGNSSTARRVAGQADLVGFNAGEAAGAGLDLMSGNVAGLTGRGVRAMLSSRAQGIAGNVADELGSRLTLQPGTDEFGQYLQQLQTAHEQQLRRALAGQAGTRTIGATVGQSWQP